MGYFEKRKHCSMPISNILCHSPESIWHRLSQLFHPGRCFSTSSNENQSSSLGRTKYKNRRSVVDRSQPIPHTMNIPPFSPTYCKPNEFPYSNFYVKLPNGNWMIRYRSGNRKILGTDELQGYLI